MKRGISILLLTLATLLSGLFLGAVTVHGQGVRADYDLAISPEDIDDSLGKVINVVGQSNPLVTFTPSYNGASSISYDTIELYIDGAVGSRKFQWDNMEGKRSFSPATYQWDICAANGGQPLAGGLYSIKLVGQDKNSSDTVVNEDTLWDQARYLKEKNQYTCGTTTSSDVDMTFVENNQTLKHKIFLKTTIASADFNKYDVLLYHQAPNQTAAVLGEYTAPTGVIEWDSSQSAAGQHQFYVQATPHPNTGLSLLRSPTLTREIDSQHKVVTSGGGGSGGSGSTLSPIKFLRFTVPDTSSLKGLTGDALRKALVELIIDLIITIVSIFAAIAVIWSGIIYALSFGDPAKAEKAKKNLTWAIIGLVIMLLTVVILSAVSRVLKSVG